MKNLRAIILHNLGLLIIFFGSVAALALAIFAQYHDGYHPCELCLVQRWIYGVVIAVCPFAHATLNVIPGRHKAGMTRLAVITVCLLLALEVGVATYHFGIEQKWWEGFQACSSGLPRGLNVEELKAKINAAPVTRCDQATWYFLGLSMAGWNVVYSAGLFLVSVLLIRNNSPLEGESKSDSRFGGGRSG